MYNSYFGSGSLGAFCLIQVPTYGFYTLCRPTYRDDSVGEFFLSFFPRGRCLIYLHLMHVAGSVV